MKTYGLDAAETKKANRLLALLSMLFGSNKDDEGYAFVAIRREFPTLNKHHPMSRDECAVVVKNMRVTPR